MQQPTSGITLKSYVTAFNCSWMSGKASKLLPLPPSWNLKQHHTLLWVAPQSQPWPPQQPLWARGRRGSPYPFLIDTQTEWRWPTPDSPPSSGTAILRVWRHRCESHCRRFWNTHVCHRTHVNRQGCAQSRLCARGQYWCKQAAMCSEENESSSIINGGDQPGDVAEVRWVKAGEAWRVTQNKCFVAASHSILLADTYTNISALNQAHLKGTVHPKSINT